MLLALLLLVLAIERGVSRFFQTCCCGEVALEPTGMSACSDGPLVGLVAGAGMLAHGKGGGRGCLSPRPLIAGRRGAATKCGGWGGFPQPPLFWLPGYDNNHP